MNKTNIKELLVLDTSTNVKGKGLGTC